MFARYGAIFVLGAVIFDPLATSAQTSSATVVSDVQNSEATPPAPARPLIVPDTYYPVQSLLSSEEGHVALKVNVGKDGKVSSVERVMPSGSARLDQVAMLLARTQWQFKPAMKDGQATEGAVNVDVAWKLPLP